MESGRKFYTNGDILEEAIVRFEDDMESIVTFAFSVAIWEHLQAVNTRDTPEANDHKYNAEYWQTVGEFILTNQKAPTNEETNLSKPELRGEDQTELS